MQRRACYDLPHLVVPLSKSSSTTSRESPLLMAKCKGQFPWQELEVCKGKQRLTSREEVRMNGVQNHSRPQCQCRHLRNMNNHPLNGSNHRKNHAVSGERTCWLFPPPSDRREENKKEQ